MQIDGMALGDFQTNCYVLRESAAVRECLVIDPGFSAEPLLKFLSDNDLCPVKVLLTHGHADHIAGVDMVRERYPEAKVCISGSEAGALVDGRENLSAMMGMPMSFGAADGTLEAGDVVELGAIQLKVLATPGHTVGGISFYCEADGVVFSGDSLFSGSIGRHDFPGGDLNTLLSAVREQLFTLPDETVVYSGHGPETTVGVEKGSNPFF